MLNTKKQHSEPLTDPEKSRLAKYREEGFDPLHVIQLPPWYVPANTDSARIIK